MNGDILQFVGGLLALTGVLLSIIVTAAILVAVNAGIILWVLYILELLFIFGGAILQALGEHL